MGLFSLDSISFIGKTTQNDSNKAKKKCGLAMNFSLTFMDKIK